MTDTVTNCNFTGNNANTGSAIYFYRYYSTDVLTVSNSIFLNNRANADALEVNKNDNNITITFTGGNNLLNAIYSEYNAEVSFTNVTYWGSKGIANTGNSTIEPSRSNRAAGQNITVGIVVNDELVLNEVKVTDENGTIVLNINTGENYFIGVRHDADSYYTEAEKTISNNTKFNVNVTSQTTTNKTVNITAKSNIYSEFMPGQLLFILPNGNEINAFYDDGIWWAVYSFDDYKYYQVTASYTGLSNVTVNNAIISITKADSTMTNYISLEYGNPINMTLTFEGATGITAEINGTPVNVVDSYTVMLSRLDVGTYTLTVTTIPDEDHNQSTSKFNIKVNKADSTLSLNSIVFDYNSTGSSEVSYTGATGFNASVANHPEAIINIVGNMITVSGLDAGTYTLKVTTMPDSNHNPATHIVNITVNAVLTQLDANAVTTTYNINKNLVITLKDSKGNVLSGVSIVVNLNGAKTYTSDKNGQIKVSTKGLAPKVYTAKVTFNGNEKYVGLVKDIKVTVKKATPKLTAKKKTFKKSVKVKKYSITLKDNLGKAIKKAKVAIKIGKKTFNAKTNSKGKATFKIKKLTKKGKYNAKVTYNGNKYYNKVTKKVKINVK